MASFLTMQLYAPLVSWGDVAVGEERPSLPHPTKSAILGLVAAALGYDRNEDRKHQDLHTRFRIGLRVDVPGSLLMDYHTVQRANAATVRRLRKGYGSTLTRADVLQLAEKLDTQPLSKRFYFVDTLGMVALEQMRDGEPALHLIAAALERPHFAPYLGRKSCSPSLPFAPRLIEGHSLLDVLNTFTGDEMYQQVFRSIKRHTRATRTLLWEADDAEGSTATVVRRDGLISRSRWQFTERRIHRRDEEVEDVSQ